MIVGRGVAVKGTGGRHQVRGHGAAAEAALRERDEQPAPCPLTCSSLARLALVVLTCGTPPARARRAFEVGALD